MEHGGLWRRGTVIRKADHRPPFNRNEHLLIAEAEFNFDLVAREAYRQRPLKECRAAGAKHDTLSRFDLDLEAPVAISGGEGEPPLTGGAKTAGDCDVSYGIEHTMQF